MESVAQINEQYYIQKNNGKLEKQNRCKISIQQQYYLKCTSKANYMSHKIFDISLVAIRKSKLAVKFNKLAYIRMCILELSKVLMYEFHYGYIKNKYENKAKLLFTATDSLMYEFKTENVYEGFSRDKEMFDFSNYSNKSK